MKKIIYGTVGTLILLLVVYIVIMGCFINPFQWNDSKASAFFILIALGLFVSCYFISYSLEPESVANTEDEEGGPLW